MQAFYLARAVLTRAVEGELMRRNLEPCVRKSSRLNLVLRVHQNVEHLTTFFADEVLVALDQRIEMLRASQHQDLKLFVRNQLLQVTVNGPEAYVGQTSAHLVIDLIGGWMGGIVFDCIPDNFQLLRIPW